jgi:CheY-like chemotaxis protein
MSRTILLADDSLTIQKVVELTFADTDYEVVAVSSGDELLRRLPDSRPDLVICDVIMPGRDGYDVCQEIKSSPNFLHLPVILLTGTFEPFDRDRAIAVGCSEIITKPFEAKKLVDAVERLVASPAAPPPTAIDTQAIGRADLGDVEDDDEFEDTEVSREYGPGEPGASLAAKETIAAGGPDDALGGFEAAGNATPEPLPEELDFEMGDDFRAIDMESTDLPDVEPPQDFELVVDASPDPAATLAAEDIADIMNDDDFEFTPEPPEPIQIEEPFESSAADDERYPTEDIVLEEPPYDVADTDTSLTTPINVAEVMSDRAVRAAGTTDPQAGPARDDVYSDVDTHDFGEKIDFAEPSDQPAPIGLSDEDVDRIARRLLELAADRIEHIAWDVVPDMAEVVVRERLREIEAEAGREPS